MSPAVIPRGILSPQAAWSRRSTDRRRIRIRAFSIIPAPTPASGGYCMQNLANLAAIKCVAPAVFGLGGLGIDGGLAQPFATTPNIENGRPASSTAALPLSSPTQTARNHLRRPESVRKSGYARIWTTANAWRATANDTLGVAVVRTLPASCAAGLRGRRHPVGARRIKRQAACRRTLHRLRRERRDLTAAGLGR